MQKITPFLWFDSQAEEAARFYTSIFKNSKIKQVTHYPKVTEKVSGKMAGTVMTVVFQLDGQEFVAINGGPVFKINPAISLVVNCDNQKELDEFWKKLSEGGKEVECGWLEDKYGVSWQVVPAEIYQFMKDAESTEKVMGEVIKMKKLDIAKLKAAA
jgi:predicted 3-demethylubiquinone-9 3-methyltransferase (glyoxalase superfamily)